MKDIYCDESNPDWAWTQIGDVQNFTAVKAAKRFDVHVYRYFIDEGQPHCNRSVFFRLAAAYGDPDIYIGAPETGAYAVSDSTSQNLVPWTSYGSTGDALHVRNP